MGVSAIGSALQGISANQAWFAAAAGAVARVETPAELAPGTEPVSPVALGPGSGQLVDAIVGTVIAAHGVEANVAVLNSALEMERSLVDVLA